MLCPACVFRSLRGNAGWTVYAQNLEAAPQKAGSEEAYEGEWDLPDVLEENAAEDTKDKIEDTKDGETDDTKEELPDDWNLILVNRTHPLPEGYEVELKAIGSGSSIDARAYDDYRNMIQAAKKEGVYIYVTSSYRDLEKQITLYDKKVESYVMQGYSYEDAKKQAGQVVAVPGTSEHHLGLALDLVSSEYRRLDEKQEHTKGFQWLKEHSWEYGFILRYPNGETEITGIIYEPWHFRYVGLEAAKEITEEGLTLEEYVGAEPVGGDGTGQTIPFKVHKTGRMRSDAVPPLFNPADERKD